MHAAGYEYMAAQIHKGGASGLADRAPQDVPRIARQSMDEVAANWIERYASTVFFVTNGVDSP